jgi:Dyp-type peroxidase family
MSAVGKAGHAAQHFGRGKLDLRQIQGLILNGYRHHTAARYALFEITDAARARRWIGERIAGLQFGEYRTTARDEPPFIRDVCINLAFTYPGFAVLGLHPIALDGFSLPFQEGLADSNRARRLGDDGQSDPAGWAWGRPGQPVHGLLALFGLRPTRGTGGGYAELQALIDADLREENGLRPLVVLDTTPSDPILRREHFGFRDGITNPKLASLAPAHETDVIADGEVLLGHENGYGHLPMSPEVPAETDPTGALAAATDRPARKDFGKNGSYLVFRQLAQDVRAFWQYAYEAKNAIPGAPGGRLGAEWLGARLVGRWPNGTPVTRYPDRPGPEHRDDENRFLYHEKGAHKTGDGFGTRCPIGSHIRRTNPRDTTLPVPHDVELSGSPDDPKAWKAQLDLTAFHRIVRRARMYGEPFDPWFDPERLRECDARERGLHFLCFNANLSRQFEFVQSNWSVNPTFAGLSSDPDPLLGAGRKVPFPAADFTMPGCPTRRIHGLPRVVEVRGGAYFFRPSRGALEYLAAAG